MCFLYVITNLINGKKYVGATNNLKQRWRHHRSGHGSRLVKAAIKKYGVENFRFEEVAEGDVPTIERLEKQTIAIEDTMTPNGYNMATGGEGSPGVKRSKETREKQSAWQRGRPATERELQMFAHFRSQPRTDASNTKRSIKLKGRTTGEKTRKASSVAHSRPVQVAGVSYMSIKKAATSLGMSYGTLQSKFWHHNKNSNFPPGWGYLPKGTVT